MSNKDDDGDTSSMSVADRFKDCEKFVHSLAELATNTPENQTSIKDFIYQLKDVTRQVSLLSLFSPNEHYSELETSHLPFLLLPAYLGHLTQLSQSSIEDRKDTLETAEVYFKDFLTRLKSYELISKRLKWEDDSGSGDTTNSQSTTMDRDEKIKIYKEQKELELNLQRLTSESVNDDEATRELYLTKLKYWAFKAFQELTDIENEKPMAERMAKLGLSDKGNTRDASTLVNSSLKPVILTKTKLQKEVFGLGYPSVSTLTVDEWYNQMVNEGRFPAKNGPSASQTKPSLDEEEEEKEKARERDDPHALREAREWSEYTDNHRRGWGFTQNKG